MSLRFVYGRSGTGKSGFVFNEIKEADYDNIFIIVPEQFSFSAETSLLRSIDSKSVIKAEVLTFSRMAERVIFETLR